MNQRSCIVGAVLLTVAFVSHLGFAGSGAEMENPVSMVQPAARIEGSSAGAELRTGGAASAAQTLAANAVLPSRFEIRTAGQPLRFRLADGTRIELAAHSRLSRVGTTEVALGATGRTVAEHWSLYAGEAQAEVPSGVKAGAVLIAANDVMVAPLPGARLVARARIPGVPPNGVSLAAYRGEARFLTRGGWKSLPAGSAVDVVASQTVLAPALLPEAPVWSNLGGACRHLPGVADDCSIALALSESGSAPVSLAWSEARGASSYILELAQDSGFQDMVLRRELKERGLTLPLVPGRYFVRTFAQGQTSFGSMPSPPRELRVVRVILPAGTATREGRWLLPRLREVEIDEPSGLELSLGPVGFVRAPARFGLAREAPITARLRVAGAADFVELPLQSATLRADIQLSPTNAVWPFDPLLVRVRVEDPGGPIPVAFAPRFSVRVNDKEAPVVWTWSEGVWETRIEPMVPPGPWVVRVQARDPYDNEIGRAFMEVSGPTRR